MRRFQMDKKYLNELINTKFVIQSLKEINSFKVGFFTLLAIVLIFSIVFSYKYTDFVLEKLTIIYEIITNEDLDSLIDNYDYDYLPDHYEANIAEYARLFNFEPPPSITSADHNHSSSIFDLPVLNTKEDLQIWENTCNMERWKENRIASKDINTDIEPVLQSSEVKEGYILNNYTMKAFFDIDNIVLYELLPNNNKKSYDSVLVIPGSGHEGARDILGIPSKYSYSYYHDEIGKRIVEEGIAVYVIELRGTGTREVDMRTICDELDKICSYIALSNRLSIIGIDLGLLTETEISQTITWIKSLPYIDKIGVVGLSRGAGYTASQALLNPEMVDAVVLASGIVHIENAPLNLEYDGTAPTVDSSSCFEITRIGTIAPTPMYLSHGRAESTSFRWEAQNGYTGNYLAQVYAIHNASDNFTYVVHDGKHEYHIPTVIDFLKTHLDSNTT